MKLLLLACLLCLAACASPGFTFRGYTHQSTCTEVEAKELQQGASFQGQSHGAGAAAHTELTTLQGHLYGEPVQVRIRCAGPDVEAISFDAQAASDAEGRALFDRLADDLGRQFGPPLVEAHAAGRSYSFMCDQSTASMRLTEEAQGAGAPGARVHLLVIPQPEVCPTPP